MRGACCVKLSVPRLCFYKPCCSKVQPYLHQTKTPTTRCAFCAATYAATRRVSPPLPIFNARATPEYKGERHTRRITVVFQRVFTPRHAAPVNRAIGNIQRQREREKKAGEAVGRRESAGVCSSQWRERRREAGAGGRSCCG